MQHAWEARAAELADLHAVLAARRPALVVLTGAPGMGKTTLLETWAARATALGWEVAGGRRRLAVTPSTDERAFGAALSESGDRARVRHGLDPLLDEIMRRAPLMVALDDYCPNPQFAEWFEDGFLPALRRCDAAVVIGVAARASRRLADRADRVVALEPLTPTEVTAALASLGDSLRPPLAPHELEVFAREARVPAVLDSLMRVLKLEVAR